MTKSKTNFSIKRLFIVTFIGILVFIAILLILSTTLNLNLTSNFNANSPTTPYEGSKITIDLGKSWSKGTIDILPGWKIVKDSFSIEKDGNRIDIQLADGLSVCGDISGTIPAFTLDNYQSNLGKIKLIKDKDGYMYLRTKSTNIPTITLCTLYRDNRFATVTKYGEIDYQFTKSNPDQKILNEMDTMIASFKEIK